MEGSYDSAVAGCDAVIHTASPYVMNVKDPRRHRPGCQEHAHVLRAATAAGVQRLILTSSMAAISDEPVEDRAFTEDDGNEQSWYEKPFGAPIAMTVVPRWMRALVGVFIPPLREMPEMQYQWEDPFAIDDRYFRKRFGVRAHG